MNRSLRKAADGISGGVVVSLAGDEKIDWLADSPSGGNTSIGDVYDEVDIVTASLSGYREVVVVA